MQQIKLISKLGLTLIAITAISAAVAMQAYYYYYIQAADATPEQPPLPPGSETPSPSLEAPRLPNNIVRSETIVNGQVQTQDLTDDSVTTAKIRNGEVNTEDLASGAVVPNVFRVDGGPNPIFPRDVAFATAVCPPRTYVTGGGYHSSSNSIQVSVSYPENYNTWFVIAINEDMRPGPASFIYAYALCMGPSP